MTSPPRATLKPAIASFKPPFDVSDTCKDLDLELVERVLVSIVALRRSEVRNPPELHHAVRANRPGFPGDKNPRNSGRLVSRSTVLPRQMGP